MGYYTDYTILTFGKYKFTRLDRVPADYLLKIYENKNKSNQDLYNYVAENLEKIIMRESGIIESPTLNSPCKKITYLNKKDANTVLAQIATTNQTHKKPIRSYECPLCSGWHLTSKQDKTQVTNDL